MGEFAHMLQQLEDQDLEEIYGVMLVRWRMRGKRRESPTCETGPALPPPSACRSWRYHLNRNLVVIG